ncbi:MAG: hypothetical protein P1V97_34805, partial [Planctomycetota bacterium]|nr:hypothetical protein [Planctomycetota bacterium]
MSRKNIAVVSLLSLFTAACGSSGGSGAAAPVAQSPSSAPSQPTTGSGNTGTGSTGTTTGTGNTGTGNTGTGTSPTPQPTQLPFPQRTAIANLGGVAFQGGAAPVNRPTITVGAGPLIGRLGTQDFFEEFQDWDAYSVKGIDREQDSRPYSDGFNSSRDIVAFYARQQGDELFFRVDLRDLQFGAEATGLDITVLIDFQNGGATRFPGMTLLTAFPYELAIRVLDTQVMEVLDGSGQVVAISGQPTIVGSYFRADLDSIEFGIKKSLLTAQGWNGTDALKYQMATSKDGELRIADAFLEQDFYDGRLDQQVLETWVAGQAKIASITVGNRAVLNADTWKDMLFKDSATSSRGTNPGLERTLETHTMFQTPLNVHMSGAFTTGIAWASDSDARKDGPAFLSRLKQFWDNQAGNGEGAFIPGFFADHMLPYFENANGNAANALLMKQTREIYQEMLSTVPSKIFWTPERVIRGQSFKDILEDENGQPTGHSFTVIDQLTHIGEWFGYGEVFASPKTYKINRINGVGCFLINHGPNEWLLQPEDGGANSNLRRLLMLKAKDTDQEQVLVTCHDWEVLSGNKNPETLESYHQTQRWMANRPWIEVVSLEDIASRGWVEVERGNDVSLPTVSNDWLHHATESNYDNWFYGHPLEESFVSLRPEVRAGQPHARRMGDVASRGTLLGDAWFEASSAPAGNLGKLSQWVFAAALYRVAWHSEDMHSLTRDAQGAYSNPDVSRDQMIGFSYGLQTHIGDAAVIARAARWAASTSLVAKAEAKQEDVDLDGEQEFLLFNDKVFYVFENDGARIKSAFVRDPLTGEAYLFLGNPLSFTGGRKDVEWEGDENANTDRNSMLKDWWLSNPGTNKYVNDGFVATITTATQTGAGWNFVSSDQVVKKTVELNGDSLSVTYDLDPAAGNIYVRGSVAPMLTTLVKKGQAALSQSDDGQAV